MSVKRVVSYDCTSLEKNIGEKLQLCSASEINLLDLERFHFVNRFNGFIQFQNNSTI